MSRTHGLPGTYVAGCRCELCREANRARGAVVRAQLAAEPRDRVPHGTRGGYTNWSCRCELCTAANTAAGAALRAARANPSPVLTSTHGGAR